MGLSVAEYLGQRTDVKTPIAPVSKNTPHACPFMNRDCDKVKKGNKPVCSVKKNNGDLWIVCKNRLCATERNSNLTDYQKQKLLSIAKVVYNDSVTLSNVAVKRETGISVTSKTKYHADFIMSLRGLNIPGRIAPVNFVVEMQGGGETSGTGNLTRHVDQWELNAARTNKILATEIDGVGSIETNAWRRQQEQFIVKGNIAINSGGGIVFCVGKTLLAYLRGKIPQSSIGDLRNENWTLCLICFDEDTSLGCVPGPIPIKIMNDKTVFTNYHTFVHALINQHMPNPEMFTGKYETLDERC